MVPFNSIMHISFFTDQLDEMIDFYQNKLGMKPKIVTRAKAYKDSDDASMAKLAELDPERIMIVYLEAAPGQFIELFPSFPGQQPHAAWNEQLGYSHFALLVDDIYEAHDALTAAGVEIDSEVHKGPSETFQFWIHDPDGNKCELMQYTDRSYQVVGSIM